MINLRRCGLLTRSYHSLIQSTTFNTPIFTSPKIFDLKSSSIDNNGYSSTPTDRINETDTKISEEDRKLKLIQLEISLKRQRGGRAPDVNFIKKHQWDELLTLNTATARDKFYSYLYVAEKTKANKVVSVTLQIELL